jgi:hypothetical protein
MHIWRSLTHLSRPRAVAPSAILVAALLAAALPAAAGTILVAANGVDGSTCGTKAVPCRSIDQGILRAANGDTIMVGPGLYGDLNHDGVLSGPGEEIPSNALCNCMILVSKSVTIVSRDGAGETIINTGGAIAGGTPLDGVLITGSNAVLGKPKKGFTITGVAGAATAAVRVANTTFGVHVAGNRAIRNAGAAFVIDGSQHVVEANRAFANGSAFSVQGIGHLVTGNLATANAVGVGISGSGHIIRGNSVTATANSGMSVSGSEIQVVGNVAAGNQFEGFFLSGTNQTFTGNAALANGRGLLIENVDATKVTVTKNTFMGNVGCGLETNLITNGPVLAPKCFWGAASGPGVDPADEVCGAVVDPVATAEIKVKVKLPPAD